MAQIANHQEIGDLIETSCEALSTRITALEEAPAGAVSSVNGETGIVVLDKGHVGLSDVDNTADSAKPVSTLQAAADAAVQAAAVQRANHTGAQAISTVTGLQTVLDGKAASLGADDNYVTDAEKTKLTGIATGATANDTDANLKNRANHTGTQLSSTISDFAATALASRVATTSFGYSTGAGGAVTQATNKATAVTLNTLCGNITMNAAALAAGAIVTFTLNNSQIAALDLLVTNHVSGGTVGPYLITPRATGAGTATITVRNTSAGSLSDAIVIRFAVVKCVVS